MKHKSFYLAAIILSVLIAGFFVLPSFALRQAIVHKDSNRQLVEGNFGQASAIYWRRLFTASASQVVFPASAQMVIFRGTKDFYLELDPSGNTDGTFNSDNLELVLTQKGRRNTTTGVYTEKTGELIPNSVETIRWLNGATRALMITQASSTVVTMSIYGDP